MTEDGDGAEGWRKLAAETYAVAAEMTDPDAKRVMLFIAEGYKRLAEQADAREHKKE
jgi:hypothetical protein